VTQPDYGKMRGVIETSMGTIKFNFYPKEALGHVKNWCDLAAKGFYDNLIFHRVIKGFMIQGGCPHGTGTGGPGYTIKAEFNKNPHADGAVSMARTNDPNSAGSQFFICDGRQSFLDNNYTVFGQVCDGLDVVHKIAGVKTGANDRPTTPVVMKKVYAEPAM
jgi:cyclophilin family peptidyl-prolyl cis-trans isomerase